MKMTGFIRVTVLAVYVEISDDRVHSSDCPCDTRRKYRRQFNPIFVVHLDAYEILVYPQLSSNQIKETKKFFKIHHLLHF